VLWALRPAASITDSWTKPISAGCQEVSRRGCCCASGLPLTSQRSGGLPPVASKCNVYIVRPASAGSCSETVLKVNWNGIVRRGETATNYQVLPNDRIYVMADPLVTFDTGLARFISPIERVLGVTLLGDSVVRQFQTPIFKNVVATTPVR